MRKRDYSGDPRTMTREPAHNLVRELPGYGTAPMDVPGQSGTYAPQTQSGGGYGGGGQSPPKYTSFADAGGDGYSAGNKGRGYGQEMQAQEWEKDRSSQPAPKSLDHKPKKYTPPKGNSKTDKHKGF